MNADWLRERIAGNRGVQAELSRQTGISPDKINKVLSGKRRVQASEVPLLLDFFELASQVPDGDRAALEDIWSQLTAGERQTLLTVGKGLRAQRQQED